MGGKVRRIRCGTRKCAGFIDTNNAAPTPKSREGNWQMHCTVCGCWSLFSDTGLMKATSRDQFDLERLPASLRLPVAITRVPPGGV
jgi:hypothetical protein